MNKPDQLVTQNLENILSHLQEDLNHYDRPFDARDYLKLPPGVQPTKAQLYSLQIEAAVHMFKGEPQYVWVHAEDGQPSAPELCIKHVPAKRAAQLFVDRKARLPEAEELEMYFTKHEHAYAEVKKQEAKHDLTQALSQMIKD